PAPRSVTRGTSGSATGRPTRTLGSCRQSRSFWAELRRQGGELFAPSPSPGGGQWWTLGGRPPSRVVQTERCEEFCHHRRSSRSRPRRGNRPWHLHRLLLA